MKHSMILVLVAAALALAACGESTQDKAQSQVCDARADIGKQVDDLKALTPATFTTDAVTKSLDAIRSDLSKMNDFITGGRAGGCDAPLTSLWFEPGRND